MNEDETMARAMKCGRSAVIPLGCIDEEDEVAWAKRQWLFQTVRYAFGVRDKVSSVCTAGYNVRSLMTDGYIGQTLVLLAADSQVVGWIERVFGLRCLWMDGWSNQEFNDLTESLKIKSVGRIGDMPYRIQSMCGAIRLSAGCKSVHEYLLLRHADRIPEDLLALLPTVDGEAEKCPYVATIDPENPRRVTVGATKAGAKPFFEKVFLLPIRHIDQSKPHEWHAVDLLGFNWRIPSEPTKAE